MNDTELMEFISAIEPADGGAMDAARKRQAELAKPPGSLGKLEVIAIRLAGVTGKLHNSLDKRRIVVFAADNGVVDEGVAITPKEVTLKQAINMTKGKTGMAAIAGFFGDEVCVIDVGIDSAAELPGIIDRKLRCGTGNIRSGAAMTRNEAMEAIAVGIEAALNAKTDGVSALGIGEIGIGNTTTSAAVLACFTGEDAAIVAGRGSGLTDAAYFNKIRVIRDAIAWNNPNPRDPIDVLSRVGGLDIAAMVGAFLGCAYYKIPAVVDGFISAVAAFVAVRLCPTVRDYIFMSHVSNEQGYLAAAHGIGHEPYLLLNMRLGEGSGCPLAFQIMCAACAVMNDMATFDEASIDDGYLDALRKGEESKRWAKPN